MAKYGFEFKKKIVLEYLSGQGGKAFLAKKYHIPSSERVMLWVKNYQTFGDDGLKRSRGQEKYSFDYKLRVVELYLSSEISYQDLALQEGIHNPSIIARWVNEFRAVGPDALRPKKKGRKKTMHKAEGSNLKTKESERIIDTSVEHVKELEDENLKLRIENAFLKEVRRLRLEEEALLKKQRESSTASEENSN